MLAEAVALFCLLAAMWAFNSLGLRGYRAWFGLEPVSAIGAEFKFFVGKLVAIGAAD